MDDRAGTDRFLQFGSFAIVTYSDSVQQPEGFHLNHGCFGGKGVFATFFDRPIAIPTCSSCDGYNLVVGNPGHNLAPGSLNLKMLVHETCKTEIFRMSHEQACALPYDRTCSTLRGNVCAKAQSRGCHSRSSPWSEPRLASHCARRPESVVDASEGCILGRETLGSR